MSLRDLEYNISDKLGKLFYPLAIGAIVVVLAAVQVVLGTEAAVFGLYALMGLGTGAAVHYGTYDVSERIYVRIDERLHRTGVYVSSAVSIGLVALTDQPLFVILGLAVGYTLVVRQMFAEPTPERLIPQLSLLFLLSPITKYLTAGWYVGHGDLLDHMRYVEDIMIGGSLEAISYSSYQQFPGLQLVAATFGSLSGLSAYDGLMVTGLAAYSVLIPAVYLLVARITDHPLLALYTAFAVTILDDVSFFVSYVFPQALATMLIVVLALLITLRSRGTVTWRATAAFVIVTLALSLTHHLTQALFVPAIGCALFIYLLRGREYVQETLLNRKMALVAFATAVTAIRYIQTGFTERLLESSMILLQGGGRGGYTEGVTLAFGRPARSSTPAAALDWLASAYGLYLILLLTVFSVAVVSFLYATDRTPAQTALFWTGVVGALVIFPTPISVKSLIRIRAPWLFMFAFVIGVGMLQLRRRIGSTQLSRVLLAGLVVLAATGPVVAADNYYGLDPRPTAQTSFSEDEVTELQAVSRYIQTQDGPTTTLWLTRLTMERNSVEGVGNPRLDGQTMIIPEGHFVYRTAWGSHKTEFPAGEGDSVYGNTLYVSEAWLEQRAASGNKVYSAGSTGVTWRPTDRPIDDM